MEPARLRISDQERHQVAEVLRQAAGEGRIDLDELDERLEATFAAKTYADLVPITVDLPVQPHQQAAVPTRDTSPASTTYETSLALMGGASRKGAWLVPERHTAFSMMGGVDLDLRQATFAAREVTIVANTIMGAVDIVVDAHTVVIVDGVGVMGSFEHTHLVTTLQVLKATERPTPADARDFDRSGWSVFAEPRQGPSGLAGLIRYDAFDPDDAVGANELGRLIAGGAYWFVWPRARVGVILTNEQVRYDLATRTDENRWLLQIHIDF